MTTEIYQPQITVAEIFLWAIDDGAFPKPYFALNSLAAVSSACQWNRWNIKVHFGGWDTTKGGSIK